MPGALLDMASVSSPEGDAPTFNKRASSRVRRRPEMFTSSPFSTGKRKRRDNGDGDIQMSDENVSGSESESADEALQEQDFHRQARASRKPNNAAGKKPAQKKPKVNGGISLPFRGSKAPARKRAPKKVRAVDVADAEAAGGIYAEVFAHDTPFDQVLSDWLKAFAEHESRALADVINFVLRSAGCAGSVNEHDIEDVDGVTARLTDLQDEHQASEPTEYPFIAKGKNATTFKKNVSDFIQAFIKAIAASDLLYSNPVLIDNIQVWFSTMTSATNRSFRHTSTIASLNVISALAEVAKGLAEKVTNNKRQAETEGKKSRVNKERVKQIEQKSKEAQQNLELVEAMLKDWFDVVFIHRYRDVDPLIRRDCVAALGDWIITIPETFFDGQHLRYLGWVLSDTSPTTRAEDLKQLHRLYSDSNKLGGLKTFTERFRARLVEIGTSDADTSVRVAGIELLNLLRENGLLEPDDIDAVGRLVFRDEFKVRKAVAAFFSENVNDLYNSKIEELGGMETVEEALPEVGEDNFDAPRLEWLHFKSLAEMLQSYDLDEALPNQFERNKSDGSLILHAAGVESRFTLAVDVLYDKIEELSEWQVLAGYLLFDHSTRRKSRSRDDVLEQLKQASSLTEKEEIVLLETLHASVKQSLSVLAEKATSSKAKLTKTQKQELLEEQEEAVRHIVDLLPRLLKKFGDNPSTAAAVLRLEAVLSLPKFQSLQQDSATNAALFEDLKKQFMSHGTDEVLAPATAAILHAKSYGDLDETTSEKLTGLWEDVVSNLAELLNVATITVRGASRTEELSALSNNLLRIVRLATVSDCIQPLQDSSVTASDKKIGKSYNGAIDFIVDLVQRAVHSSGPKPDADDSTLEDEIASRAAEAALFYFRWKLLSIISSITTGKTTGVTYEVLEALAERRDAYVNNLTLALQSRKPGEQVSISLANCLLDLYTSAAILRTAQAKPGVNDDYTVLIMDLESTHEKAILKVFVAAEREFAKLSGKKIELASPADEAAADEDGDTDAEADPIDDDPDSESDAYPEDDAAPAVDLQQRRDARQKKSLLAEQRLCQLTSKLIYAVAAGVIDDRATRKRLERNKTRLGPNFKEVLAYLDLSSLQKKKQAKGKKPVVAAKNAPPRGGVGGGGSGSKSTRPNPKSNAIVAEDETDDEIEDDDEEDHEQAALNRRDEEGEEDEDEQMGPIEEEEDEQSVIGD